MILIKTYANTCKGNTSISFCLITIKLLCESWKVHCVEQMLTIKIIHSNNAKAQKPSCLVFLLDSWSARGRSAAGGRGWSSGLRSTRTVRRICSSLGCCSCTICSFWVIIMLALQMTCIHTTQSVTKHIEQSGWLILYDIHTILLLQCYCFCFKREHLG